MSFSRPCCLVVRCWLRRRSRGDRGRGSCWLNLANQKDFVCQYRHDGEMLCVGTRSDEKHPHVTGVCTALHLHASAVKAGTQINDMCSGERCPFWLNRHFLQTLLESTVRYPRCCCCVPAHQQNLQHHKRLCVDAVHKHMKADTTAVQVPSTVVLLTKYQTPYLPPHSRVIHAKVASRQCHACAGLLFTVVSWVAHGRPPRGKHAATHRQLARNRNKKTKKKLTFAPSTCPPHTFIRAALSHSCCSRQEGCKLLNSLLSHQECHATPSMITHESSSRTLS